MFSKFKDREDDLKVLLMCLAGLLFFALLTFSCSSSSRHVVETKEIRSNLCAQEVCAVTWNLEQLEYCTTSFGVPPDMNTVTGTYILGHKACYCPCDFAKFFDESRPTEQSECK